MLIVGLRRILNIIDLEAFMKHNLPKLLSEHILLVIDDIFVSIIQTDLLVRGKTVYVLFAIQPIGF